MLRKQFNFTEDRAYLKLLRWKLPLKHKLIITLLNQRNQRKFLNVSNDIFLPRVVSDRFVLLFVI